MGQVINLWRLENHPQPAVIFRRWVCFGDAIRLRGPYILRLFREGRELDYIITAQISGDNYLFEQPLYPIAPHLGMKTLCGLVMHVRAVEDAGDGKPCRVFLEFVAVTDPARRAIRKLKKAVF